MLERPAGCSVVPLVVVGGVAVDCHRGHAHCSCVARHESNIIYVTPSDTWQVLKVYITCNEVCVANVLLERPSIPGKQRHSVIVSNFCTLSYQTSTGGKRTLSLFSCKKAFSFLEERNSLRGEGGSCGTILKDPYLFGRFHHSIFVLWCQLA